MMISSFIRSQSGVLGCIDFLKGAAREWANTAGVAEYIGIMLLDGGLGSSCADALHYLRWLTESGSATWVAVFWRIIGKCDEKYITVELADLIHGALLNTQNWKVIEDSLMVLSRYSQKGAQKLGSIILWGMAVPRVLSWEEVIGLAGRPEESIRLIADRLRSAYLTREDRPEVNLLWLPLALRAVARFSSGALRERIESTCRQLGRSKEAVASGAVIRLLWGLEAVRQPYALNGLASRHEGVRVIAADQLRFVKPARSEVCAIIRLVSTTLAGDRAGQVLSDTVDKLKLGEKLKQ